MSVRTSDEDVLHANAERTRSIDAMSASEEHDTAVMPPLEARVADAKRAGLTIPFWMNLQEVYELRVVENEIGPALKKIKRLRSAS